MTWDHDIDWRGASRYWLPVLLWMLLIFLASSQTHLPTARSGGLDFLIKKGGHLAEYAVLGVLLLRAFRFTWPGARSAVLALLALSAGLLYALSDEIHQFFVPTRHSRPGDVLVDVLGLLLAVLLVRLSRRHTS